MRLINTETLRLEEHADPIPPYAILSHTWGQQEVDFQGFQKLCEQEREEVKSGPSKIGHVCRVARQNGLGHVWVDTCCIDKSSTADVSEAVNSMYRYYQDAQVCYVYLADATSNNLETWEGSLRKCRWFKRGWTLQELIAPRRVTFYDQAWAYCGQKTDPALLGLLSSITAIDEDVLQNLEAVTSVPVSTRMAWAADRDCTRPEDVAYSLMGIFDVNMPLLYGEGAKAFVRLQEEISRRNLDLSLLAWAASSSNNNDDDDDQERDRGLLAKSPAEFRIFKRFTLVRSTVEGQSEVTVVNGCLRLVGGKVFTRTSGVFTQYILDLGWIGKGGSSGSNSHSHSSSSNNNSSSSSFFWRVGILLRKALGAFVRAVPQKLFVVKIEDVQYKYSRALHMRMSLTSSDLESLRRLSVDLAASSDDVGKHGAGLHSRVEYEWGSYTSTGCRTKQIETMFDNGLCLDMRNNQHSRVLRGLEPWALRPTLFWKVWPGGSSNATAVKVFLRYYEKPSLRRRTSSQNWQGKSDWPNCQFKKSVPAVHSNTHDSSAASLMGIVASSAEQPPRKRRRDGLIMSTATATTPPGEDTPTKLLPSYSPTLFPSRFLACPFYMADKLRFTPCKDSFLHTIQDVQQHLWQRHVRVQPPYCPVCMTTFERIGDRDAHIVQGECKPSPSTCTTTTKAVPAIPGSNNNNKRNTTTVTTTTAAAAAAEEEDTMTMTEDQHRRILHMSPRSASTANLADFQVWYKIWEELFPGARYPPSVWLGSETEEISEITSLIWNRFLAEMRTTMGPDGNANGDANELDEDVVRHFELSRLSNMSTGGR